MDVGRVEAVHRDGQHRFSKQTIARIELLEGVGVDGDAHSGATVRHLSRVRRDPSVPNLRQVHLIHAELFEALAGQGYDVGPGQLGENITTKDVDLLGLPSGTVLHLGDTAIVCLTGLRNPCVQIERFGVRQARPGLLKEVLHTTDAGEVVRLAGVMGVVVSGGSVAPGDDIRVALPEGLREPLTPV
jgi:MOSC domain-containing protein YiiM